MSLNYDSKKKSGLRTLRDTCVEYLINNKHALGRDMPGISAQRPQLGILVLAHCNAEELQRIEDSTLEKSGHDIKEKTWQIWRRLYRAKFGLPPPEEVPPLVISNTSMDTAPVDMGDYRTLYEYKERQKQEQTRQLAAKLRKVRRNEEQVKEKTKAKRINAVTGAKRSRPRANSRGGRLTSHVFKSNPGMSREEFYTKLGVNKSSKSIMKRRW